MKGSRRIALLGGMGVPGLFGGGPHNTVAPAISATATIGTTITPTPGTWTGSPTLTYQWQRYSAGAWADIASATTANRAPVDADFGLALRLVEIPNGDVAKAAYSNSTYLTNYSLLDQFTTAQAAPLSDPLNANPGPGILRKSADSANHISLTGGEMVQGGQAAAADPAYYWTELDATGFTRAAGLALLFTVSNLLGGFIDVGWAASTTLTVANIFAGVGFGTNFVARFASQNYFSSTNTHATRPLRFALVLQSSGQGALLIVNNRLLAVAPHDATATLWPFIRALSAGSRIHLDNVSGVQLIGDWATNLSQVTDRVTPASAADIIDSAADAVVYYDLTYTAGETKDIMIRRVDDDNCWIVRHNQNANTTHLIEKVATVETERGAGTYGSFTGARPLRIRMLGQRIEALIFGTAIFTAYNKAYTNRDAVTIKITHASTGALESWPIEMTLPAAALTPVKGFLPFGDSKTVAAADTVPDTDGSLGYPYRLRNLLTGWDEMPARLAVGGTTAASWAPIIDAQIGAMLTRPECVLVNLGANDVAGGLPVEATFKTNYGLILDAWHCRYPNALVGCMQVWVRNFGADCITLNGWIADVVAARSTWAKMGPDEGVFLENGDDGATYTADGIHPNAAGYTLTAQQWYVWMVAQGLV